MTGTATGDGAPERSTSPERWRVPLIASALVLAAGLVLEAWTDDAPSGGGAALIVIGVAGALVSGLLALRPLGSSPAGSGRAAAAPIFILLVGLPAIVWAASGVLLTDRPVQAAIPAGNGGLPASQNPAPGTTTAHTHAATPTTSAGAVPATSEPAAEGIAAVVGDPEFHDHGVATPEVPLDQPTRDLLGRQLVIARDVALQYPTVAAAEAAGYRAVTKYLPLIGAHYMRFSNLTDGFVPEAPEMLLFDGSEPGSRIVGLSYFVVGGAEPDGFAGPNDHWHQHRGLCLRGTFVVGGERVSEEECNRRGGVKAEGLDAWMVHAWVVPGWESPQGVFSPEHSGLV
jgi:hypothetical protein